MTAWLLERARLPHGVADDVLVHVEDGRFTRVTAGVSATEHPGTPRLAGLTLPGFANAHSHVFHRGLRGRTQTGAGSFWTWREQMYDLAGRLDPDSYHDLAVAAYAEMVAAGWTSVGEFHYLHHAPDGTAYPGHAMEEALVAAADEVGIRLALLDTCYLSAGFGDPPAGVQVRYSDGTVERWAERVTDLADRLADRPGVRLGVAAHSVRAVPADALETVARVAHQLEAVLHVHVSEQVAENSDCLARHGTTPVGLLAEHGLLGPRSTLVHATHLTEADVAAVGASRSHVCFCPTTERDLGDGIGPSRALHAAGAVLTLGTDSHAVVDPFEEMRAVELDERLATRRRGHWRAAELLDAGAAHRSLGFDDVGRIEVGAAADLVTVDLDSPRTAGTGGGEETVVFAATAADVTHVVVAGRVVHTGDTGAVGRRLAHVLGRIWA